MINFIKKILDRIKPTVNQPIVVSQEPPDLDYSDLKNNFDKRTYSFPFYEKKLSNNLRLLHWMGSVDYSGYTRESSLKYLILHYVPGDENRILLRLEDWVPSIQKLAEQWTIDHFHTIPISQLNENYKLILYLSRKEKLQQSPVIHAIHSGLVSHLHEIELTVFFSLHPSFRRFLYTLGISKVPRLRRWLIEDQDPFNRSLLLTLCPYDDLTNDEIQALKNDKSVMVRKKFIMEHMRHGEKPSQKVLTHYCFDNNAGIRPWARFYLKKCYNVSAYDLYIEKDDETFYYLADFNKKEDIDVFVQGIQSKQKHIKTLCLKALCKADPTYLRSLDVEVLLCENSKIRKTISAFLPGVFTIDQLKQLKQPLIQSNSQGILTFLHLIYRKSFWEFTNEALQYLIEPLTQIHESHISNILYKNTSISEKLSENLKHQITEKTTILINNESSSLKNLAHFIQFTLKHH